MASKRTALVAAVKAALEVASVDGTTKPTGLTVHRSWDATHEAADLPIIVIHVPRESVAANATVKTDRSLQLWLECKVQREDDSDPLTDLDPLFVWAVKALEDDHTLGGACMNIEEQGTEFDLASEGQEFAQAQMNFLATYQTNYRDPENV